MRKLFILLTFCATQLKAQDSTKIPHDVIPFVELEAVGISAVRASSKAPIPLTNMSKAEIDEVYVGQHPIFLLEKSTPGLFSYSESGTSIANAGQLRLRGISQERINFTLNGVPLNDMIDQGVFFSNFTDISSNFESIQVQRGVGTSSNGVSSYGGSINFESLNLKGKESFSRLNLGAASFDGELTNTLRGNIQHFTGINEKGWGVMSSFSSLQSDGYKDNAFTNANTYFMTGGYFGDDEVFKFTFFTSRSENGLAYLTTEESILDKNSTTNLLSENDVDDFTQYLAQAQYNRTIKKNWVVGATAYYGGAKGDFITFGLNYPLKNEHIGGMVNTEYKVKKLKINAGLHAYTFLRENTESNLDNLANPFYNESSQKNEISAFAKASYELNNTTLFGEVQLRSAELIISPDYSAVGIPSEGDIYKDWLFVNPRVGITQQLTEKVSAYASFGRSGREPTKIDLFGGFRLDSNNYQLVREGGFVTEEYVNDLEVGGRYNSDKLRAEINFYYMSFENEIAPNGAQLDFGVGARRNIKNSIRTGVEMYFTYLLNDYIELGGNLAYLSTSIDEFTSDSVSYANNQHILSPDWIANAQVKVNPLKNFAVTFSGRYISEQFMSLPNDPKFIIPSSFVNDLSFEYKFNERITTSFFINNLLDVKYYTFGAPTDNQFDGVFERGFFVQPPRNFAINVVFNL